MSFPFFFLTHDCIPIHSSKTLMEMMQQQLLTWSHHLHRGMRRSIMSSSGPEHLEDHGDDNWLWESRKTRHILRSWKGWKSLVFLESLWQNSQHGSPISQALSTWGDFFSPNEAETGQASPQTSTGAPQGASPTTVWYTSCTAAEQEGLHRVMKTAQHVVGMKSYLDTPATWERRNAASRQAWLTSATHCLNHRCLGDSSE